MKVLKIYLVIIILLLALSAWACKGPQLGAVKTEVMIVDQVIETVAPDVIPPTENIQSTATLEESSEPSSKRYSFDQLGISLEVPGELFVRKNLDVNYEDSSKLNGYQFYIQNYGHPGGESSGDFQMYGHFQYDLPPITWEEFSDNTINSPVNAYANEIVINGLRGFDTQYSTQRNRFVYQFFINGQILSIAVSQPTEENKVLADQIISTINFDQGDFTNKSRVQKIVDPNGYYQMYIPDDWKYTFNSTAGIRLSDLEASSPNAEVLVEETGGPHSNIYYKNGIFMNIAVLEDDSAKSEPNMASIQSSYPLMVYGIEGMNYVFVEPSTAEGELREVRFYYDEKSFLLRFGYPLDVDQDLLDWMIRSLQIME